MSAAVGPDDLTGHRLEHYEIRRKLGKGGMGRVYEASDTKLDRRVALKVLAPDLRSPEAQERFRREAKALAAIDHPNIVKIYAIESTAGADFITMEFVPGRTLHSLAPAGGMALETFFGIAVPILEAVSAAHDADIVHRDLKPDNVMIRPDGVVKVLDFGLAKHAPSVARTDPRVSTEGVSGELTREGAMVGTVPYMSPEQVLGDRVDKPSDIFSLGTILYEMLSGERPFAGDSTMKTAAKILDASPPTLEALRPALPKPLARVIMRCLERAPDARFEDARSLLEALTDAKRSLGGTVVRRTLDPLTALARRVRPELGRVLLCSLLVNLPLVVILVEHFPRWDRTFLSLLQLSPGQYLLLFLLLPCIIFLIETALANIKRMLDPSPRFLAPGVRALIAVVFGLLTTFGGYGGSIGIDQLPREPGRTAVAASRTLVEAVRDGPSDALAGRLEREASESPVAAVVLPLAAETGSSIAERAQLVRVLGTSVRGRALETPEAQAQLRQWVANHDVESSLVSAVSYLQLNLTGALSRWMETRYRRLARFVNQFETVAIMYAGTGLLFGTIALLTLWSRQPRQDVSAEALLSPTLALAFAAALLSVWPPLRAYTIHMEALIWPKPGGASLMYPFVVYAFCLTQGASLALVLRLRHVLGQLTVFVILALTGYLLVNSQAVTFLLDANIGAGAHPRKIIGCLAVMAPMVLAMVFMMSAARVPRDTALRETSA